MWRETNILPLTINKNWLDNIFDEFSHYIKHLNVHNQSHIIQNFSKKKLIKKIGTNISIRKLREDKCKDKTKQTYYL